MTCNNEDCRATLEHKLEMHAYNIRLREAVVETLDWLVSNNLGGTAHETHLRQVLNDE